MKSVIKHYKWPKDEKGDEIPEHITYAAWLNDSDEIPLPIIVDKKEKKIKK